MSVQKCTNFIERTGKGDVTTDCESDAAIETYVTGHVQANTKYIGQYFNIHDFEHDAGVMDFIGYQHTSTMLFWGESRMQTYTVQRNTVSVYS